MKKKDIIINIIVSIVLVIILLAINGIYPFGNNIINNDNSLYYVLWNILHGKSSLVFDYNTGLEIFSTLVSNSILLPLNILVGIVSKNNIPYMLSYIFIIRFLLTYFISYIFLNKIFKDKKYIYLLLFIYMILSYYLIDISIMLYISGILLGLYYILNKKKDILFSISLSLLLIRLFSNWYIGLIGIILFSIIYIVLKKDKLIKIIYILIYGLLGLGISCIILIPSLYEYKGKIVSNDEYIDNNSISSTLNTNIDFINDGYRYVNMYGLDNNYSYLLNIPSLSNGNIYVNEDIISMKDTLGLGGSNTTIYYYGGTLFTDLILNNKYIITYEEMNDKLYELIKIEDDIYYYKSKYSLNYLIPYDGEIYNMDYGSFIENNNNIYKILFNMEDDLIHEVEVKSKNKIYSFKATKNKEYYIYVTPEAYEDTRIYIDNEDVDIKCMYYNNDDGFVTYKIIFSVNKDTTINLDYDNFKIESIDVGYIDIDEYIDFVSNIEDLDIKYINNISNIEYKYNSNNDEYVLIPINYNDNYKISINDKEIDYEKNIYNMVSIKVNKGSNDIKISYKLKYSLVSSLISVISLIILVLLFIFRKRIKY